MAPKKSKRPSGDASTSRGGATAPVAPPVPTTLPKFVNSSASDNYFNFYRKKKIITGRKVVFSAFADLRLEHTLAKFKLVTLLTLNLPTYPKLIPIFFANLLVDNQAFTSRVNGVNICMTFQAFAEFLGMPHEGFDVYPFSLRSIEPEDFPEGHTMDSLITTLYGHPFPEIFNENIHLFAPIAQILAKIIFHNIVPKSGEFDRARGCVPILVYCIMAGIPVNIPSLILNQICAANLATSPKGLPFGMLFTSLFAHWGVPVAGSETIDPPRGLDSSFLSRKRSHLPTSGSTHEEGAATDPVDPITLPASSSSHCACTCCPHSHTCTISRTDFEEMCAAMRYQFEISSAMMTQRGLAFPEPTLESHPMSFSGPPFSRWVPTHAHDSTHLDTDTGAGPSGGAATGDGNADEDGAE